eukprot:TRINITY_DN17765_c0_g1_i10.p1 TRINITY_DN17765_c0_g1~~TRINITY_DN17765_c0_g1_i10.p1  ORF type:complete len:539 (-),score=65.21 TRINITY_DN17765_c0_g1_i10:375-1991(-)
MLILLLVVACVTFLTVYGFRLYSRIRLRRIPGPPPSWLFGNLLQIKHLVHSTFAWMKEYGPIFKYYMGGVPIVVISDPEWARKVFMKSHYRPYKALGLPLSGLRLKFNQQGLFWSKGQQFKTLKSAWQVAFNQGSVQNYFPLMLRHTDELCETLSKKSASGEVFDIWREVQKMTLEVVGTTAFGIDFKLLDNHEDNGSNNNNHHKENNGKVQEYGMIDSQRMIENARVIFGSARSDGRGARKGPSPWMIMNFIFPELRPLWCQAYTNYPISEHERVMKQSVMQLISDSTQLAKYERQKGQQNSDDKASKTIDPGSFLARLLKTKDWNVKDQLLRDLQVAAQAFIFILAGFETTANALAFTVYLLCKNPKKKEKLVEELKQIGDISPEVLEKCKYLEAVFKESLRLFPPGAMAVRQAEDDIQIGGYIIPRDTAVTLNIYGLQRDPTLWTDPDAFIPERFLEGSPEYVADKLHQFTYMPFGGGSRMCIGHKYALQEAKLALFKIYKKVDFELEEGQEELETKVAITMSPKHGIRVTAKTV